MTDTSASPGASSTLRLGLSSGALYPAVATEDVPEAAARMGVADLELMLQTAGEHEPAFVRQLRANLQAAGTRLHAVHSYQPPHPLVSPYRRRAEEARDLFRRAVALTGELGGHAIVWHGLCRAELDLPDAWERLLATTADLASICVEAKITLALENVSWCALPTVRDVMAFAARISELGSPGSIGFAFDPFQASEAGANPFMILAAMEPHLADVHLSDFRAGGAARHLLPGDGDLPWPALLRAVANSGYRGPMMVEAPVPDAEAFARVHALIDPVLTDIAAEADPCAGTPPAGVREGIALFNEQKFYEAHEVIEHEWHAERRPVRRLYQGILQIGVGFHHARGGNHKGALLLLADGIAKTSAFQPACQGLDTARLVCESQLGLDRLAALGPRRLAEFDWSSVPLVHPAVSLEP
ncbi:MAG: DUF309 domain-containing protein [Thermomicrobiales bacterium]